LNLGLVKSWFKIEEFGNCFGTDDFAEGTSAFLEKRKANFLRSNLRFALRFSN